MSDFDLTNYLPEVLRKNPAWKKYVESIDDVIVKPIEENINALLELRSPRQVEVDQLTKMKKLLGLFIRTSGFSESQMRTLVETTPYYWSTSGTKSLIDFLSFVRKADFLYNEYYARRDFEEDLDTGDGSTVTFAGTLTLPPVEETSIKITDGVEWFSDSAGVLTGTAGGTGTIDYETGIYSVTFNTAPANGATISTEYFTKVYQFFTVEEDIDSEEYELYDGTTYTLYNDEPYELFEGAQFVWNGGKWYLTNHVELLYDTEEFDQGTDELTSIFYELAPAVLVLHKLIEMITARGNVFVSGAATHTEYIVSKIVTPPPAAITNGILLEDSSFLLDESGNPFVLEL